MDYLDPKTELRHRVILLTGYVLLAVIVVTTSVILLVKSLGFGVKNGTVILSGFAFFSSQPHPAAVSLNGALPKANTNIRLQLPEGTYHVKLSRAGYRDWQRTVTVVGDSVEHFDYPLLVPKTLTTKQLSPVYDQAPGFMTQSPDRRWLLVQRPGSLTNFDVYDLKNPTKAPLLLTLPADLLTKATTTLGEGWQLGEWADDNQHLLLQHTYDSKTEFILVDRTVPDKSRNLTTTFSLTQSPVKLSLVNKKYDQYYVYDQTAATLQTASLKTPSATLLLTHVLAYQSYSDDTVLYVTDSDEPAGQVEVKLKIGSQTSLIHRLPSDTTYLLDLTKYDGTMYVAAGAVAQGKIYVYRDPVAQLATRPDQALIPAQTLFVATPDYLSFSTNAQFIVAEGGSHFGVYDIQNKTGYNYTVSQGLDQPQEHASWMDGDRLTYVSGGKLVIVDYDATNAQLLMAAGSAYLPAFAPDYKDVYVLAGEAGNGQFAVTQTSLLRSADR